MATHCKGIDNLIPSGNDFYLAIALKSRSLVDGEVVETPFDFEAADTYNARIYGILDGATLSTMVGLKDGSTDTVIVDAKGVPLIRAIGVEVTGTVDGRAFRAAEKGFLSIVEFNGEAKVVFTPVTGGQEANLVMVLTFLPSAAVVGKNAYEIWKEEPGNQDKTLADFIYFLGHGESAYEIAVRYGYTGTEAEYNMLYFDAVDVANTAGQNAQQAADTANEMAAQAQDAAELADAATTNANNAATAAAATVDAAIDNMEDTLNAAIAAQDAEIEEQFATQTALINQKQMEIGAVPSDLTPTEGSTNWVTSGGVYNSTPSIVDSNNSADLDIADENRNVLARFSNGNFRVKNFDSEKNNINLGVDSVEEFSSSKAYLINEIVRRDGLLYKFIESHEAGEWDSSQVEQTNVMQALTHPVEVEESNNNSDLDVSDESGNVLVRFRGGHFQVKNFNSENIETKRHINILFFGNSLTQDAITYTPLLLKEIAPEIEFTLYDWYNAGATLEQQYTNLQNDTACQIFSEYDSKTNSWVNYNNTKNISWVLENCNFDILCLQEYSYYEFTDQQLITNFDNVANYFCENYNKALKIIYLIDAPNRSKVETMMTLAEHYATTCMKQTVCESILPTGNAIYYALQTSLSTLGDVGGLSPDGTHAQEGLPCLLQAYVVAMWIFKELGIAKSVFGSKVRVTTSVYTQLNPPGANLGSGVITGTDAQHLIAQECAIKAFKRGQTLIMDSLINNN